MSALRPLMRAKRPLALIVAAAVAGSAFAVPAVTPVRYAFQDGERGAYVILGLKQEPGQLRLTPPPGERLHYQATSFKRCFDDYCEQETKLRTDKGEYLLVVQWLPSPAR